MNAVPAGTGGSTSWQAGWGSGGLTADSGLPGTQSKRAEDNKATNPGDKTAWGPTRPGWGSSSFYLPGSVAVEEMSTDALSVSGYRVIASYPASMSCSKKVTVADLLRSFVKCRLRFSHLGFK